MPLTEIGSTGIEVLSVFLKREAQFDRTKKFTWKTSMDDTYVDYSVFAVIECGREASDRMALQRYLCERWEHHVTEKALQELNIDQDMDELYREFVKKYPFRIRYDFEYLARGEEPVRRGRNRHLEFQESGTVSVENQLTEVTSKLVI